ncbi:MAG: glycosyltransferase, partial [Candidatus Hydrogenedentota bacterium]
MFLIWYALLVLGVGFLLIAAYLWFLAFASFRPERRRGMHTPSEKHFAIIVPAHNESKVIRRTISSLKNLDYPVAKYEIVVVADNCTDDTAQIVRESGVRCLERSDEDKRGKGFALDWAFTQLKGAPFDAFVIIDADTIAERHFLRAMNQRLCEGEKAIQGYYDVMNPEKSAMASLSYLSFVLSRNLRYKGRTRLGWSSNLLGNGMCFASE